MAGLMAFEEGMRQADPMLLVPMMALEVETPEEYAGTGISDVSAWRGPTRPGPARRTAGMKLTMAAARLFGRALSHRSAGQVTQRLTFMNQSTSRSFQ
jgi:elongation factor G